jgi:hypothetical protein
MGSIPVLGRWCGHRAQATMVMTMTVMVTMTVTVITVMTNSQTFL